MKTKSGLRASVVLMVFLFALALMFSGCSVNNPTASQDKDANINTILAKSSNGPIYILKKADAFTNYQGIKSLAKTSDDDDDGESDGTFSAEKFFEADEGGTILIGDDVVGYSHIIFKPYDLPEDITIHFDWAASATLDGILNNAQFGPHGLYFNNPVEVELSYKTAEVTTEQENNLRIYYFNEDTELWEFVGGSVDKVKKTVKSYLEHFSRYAVAYSN